MAVAKSYKMRTITIFIKFVRLMMTALVFNLETQKLLRLEYVEGLVLSHFIPLTHN